MTSISNKTVNHSYQVLGVEVDALTIASAVDQIITKAANPHSKPSYVVKPYVEFLERGIIEPEVLALLNSAEWCLADGVALVWAAHYLYGGRCNLPRLVATLAQIVLMPRRLRREIPANIAGINFTWPLLESARAAGLKVYLIGSPRKGGIAHTAKTIEYRLPGIQVAGYFSGHFDKRLEAKLTSELRSLRPDIILVGMGFPLQEQLMSRLMDSLDHGVMIGEGGTFDYRQFGGDAPRAPRFLQTVGLEWLWRLALQPSRIVRQLAIPAFIFHVYLQGRELRSRRKVS
jgi:N-acetylglucosaminyldiphosphoundecaprenol N-acetyl-beta-D-mannosaminyltransferase